MVNPRRIGWLGGLATLAALVAGSCLVFVRHVDHRWDEFCTRADSLQERLDTADTRRPVLYGKTTPGNAWSAYRAAIELAARDPRLEEQVRPHKRARMEPDGVAALLEKHEEILVQLHRGAHCERAHLYVDWSKGFSHSTQNLLVLRGLSNLAVMKALALARHGQPVAAAETLLDAAQLGRDLMHSHVAINELIGCAVLHISTSEALQNNDLLQSLPAQGLDRLARGLAALDAGIARVGRSLHGEAVLSAQAFQSPELLKEMGLSGDAWDAWRYGFSSRLMFATAGLQMMEVVDQSVAAAATPWSACDNYLEGLEAEMANAYNPLLSGLASLPRLVLVPRLRSIARLRMLRMWIEHRRGRPIPELEDPFGGTLQHEDGEDGRTRFVSLGPEARRDLFLFPRRP